MIGSVLAGAESLDLLDSRQQECQDRHRRTVTTKVKGFNRLYSKDHGGQAREADGLLSEEEAAKVRRLTGIARS